MKDITVILNCFKRPHTLESQFKAIENQTIQPKNVLIWQNKGDYENFKPFNENIASNCATSISNSNFGVWARFAYALNARTEYVCVFDDDTIPGPEWLENCYETIQKYNGLLGAVGVTFNDLQYNSYDSAGWRDPNEEVKEVDIVGHSWFFKREWLGSFWKESEIPLSYLCGEDIHFSYAIQKYLKLKTYVPPHPKSNKKKWGSDPELAYKYGVDNAAVSVRYHQTGLFANNLLHYKNKGFKFIKNI